MGFCYTLAIINALKYFLRGETRSMVFCIVFALMGLLIELLHWRGGGKR